MKLAIVLSVLLAACGSDSPKFPVDKLQDPATCKQCHSKHYDEWAGSMHAYASDDPVFLAMNKRGQRDTNGQLGTFCLQCHAPMAVAMGLTDGQNFDPTQLPPTARGITCYFCHDVAKVTADHNNGLELALDDTMRGAVTDPTDSPAHHSKYDKLMDAATNDSTMCGGCHDVTTPRGIALERSFAEWKTTIFAQHPVSEGGLSCTGCHMQSDRSTDIIADGPNLHVKARKNSFHEHMWLGVDEQLTAFATPAQATAQDTAIHRDLDYAITIVGPTPTGSMTAEGGICVIPDQGGQITVRMDTRGPGHMWPSGAAQDRRAWLELIAYDASNNVVFSSGTVADNQDPEDLNEPTLFGLWDRTVKDDGTPAHFFWEVAQPPQSNLLKPPVTLDQNSPLFDHSSTAKFSVPNYTQIDHITARVRIRPLPLAALNDLVGSGDLDPSIVGKLQTFDLPGATRHWIKANVNPATGCDKNPFE